METETKQKNSEEKVLEKEIKTEKTENKKTTEVKSIKTKIKKDEAKVYGNDLAISLKSAVEICRFIKKKNIDNAIEYLEMVANKKKPIPMRGEYAHRKGKGISSGKYPLNASREFIRLLKNLKANSIVNGLVEPIIAEAIPNKASRPFGKGGRIRKKRCHVTIIAREKKGKTCSKK